jgi:hypothetical protein
MRNTITRVLAVVFMLGLVLGLAAFLSTTKTPGTGAGEPVALGTDFTLAIGERQKLVTGMTVTLLAINDSRCKPDVQCIWEGELSPVLQIEEGAAGKVSELILGTSIGRQSASYNEYSFKLRSASEKEAKLVVTLP